MSHTYWVVDDDGQPQPVDVHTWTAWRLGLNDDRQIRVARDNVGDTEVSTVFLSLNYDHARTGVPVLYETMILGGEYDLWCRRYTTRAGALAGHASIVDNLTAGRSPEEAP